MVIFQFIFNTISVSYIEILLLELPAYKIA